MADESENIEARLAAYIDGDLPEQDRADIEQYLAANPSHAKLIAELRQQRAKLAGLPSEKAPPEIMDHLQQHLERHALLDDSDGESNPMRVSRLPQLTAIAAMLMLAAGLGLLVYQVLPGGGKAEHLVLGPNVAKDLPQLPSTEESATEPTEDQKGQMSAMAQRRAATNSDALPAPAMADNEKSDRQSQQMMMAQNSATQQGGKDQLASAPDASMAPGAAQLKAGVSPATPGIDRPRDYVESLADDMLQKQTKRLDETMAAPHATITITTDDPGMSAALTRAYLSQNNLTIDTLPLTADKAAATQPAIAPMVLHNVTADRAKQIQTEISELRAGRQTAVLAFAPPAPIPTTAPAVIAAAFPAVPPAAPKVVMQQARTELRMERSAPSTSPSAQPDDVSETPTSQSTTQPTLAVQVPGDLWIVIEPSAPTRTLPPTTLPVLTTQPTTQP